MAEHLQIHHSADRKEKYALLLPQLRALLEGETDPVANMANCCAALRQTFGFFWIGFYLVKDVHVERQVSGANASAASLSASDRQLVLGPFQGDVACTRIAFGKGVCGSAWQHAQTIVVPDVDAFPGHIACSSLSRSEIVVPLIKNNQVIAVLDVDSDILNDFSEDDRYGLEAVAQMMAQLL
jgi:L-methionine (R)-S-oxide reductase